MRRPCREVERFIESGAERMPDALQAHLAQCARCQRAWQLETAYQRALQATREEPVPACDLPWSRVQAQLAARAVVRRAPIWQRYAFAGGLAIAMLVVSLAWLTRMPSPTPLGDAQPEANLVASAPSQAPREEPLALLTPEPLEGRPPAPKRIASTQPKPRLTRIARASQPAAPLTTAAPTPGSAQPTAEMTLHARPLPPAHAEQATRRLGGAPPIPSETMGELAFRVAPEAEPFTVASLPLSQFELYNSSQVEYLPVRYGTLSSKLYHNEGNENDAIICSF